MTGLLFDALFSRVFTAIIMGGTSVGRNSSFGVDYTKARMAAGRLFAIIDGQPKIDVDQTGAKQLVSLHTSSGFIARLSWYLP